MDLNTINSRVDQALLANRRAERTIIYMAIAMFVVGLSVMLVGYHFKNPYVASGSILAQSLLVFPINEIKKLRRDNVILQVFPAMIDGLPPAKAASEIVKLLEYLRRGK